MMKSPNLGSRGGETAIGRKRQSRPQRWTKVTTWLAPALLPLVVPVAVSPAKAFVEKVSAVTAAELPYTWRPGCPVGPSQLRELHMDYWGFDGKPHLGAMVVNVSVVADVVKIFRTLYDDRFPIREMVPQDSYHGNDNAAAAADDTSGFNCRYAVAPGAPRWSVHAYGEAIDVNDIQNPYVDGNTVIPPAGKAYLDRSDVRPGMAVREGPWSRRLPPSVGTGAADGRGHPTTSTSSHRRLRRDRLEDYRRALQVLWLTHRRRLMAPAPQVVRRLVWSDEFKVT